MTTNPTPNMNLSRPDFNSSSWHTDVNGNWVKLDNALGSLNIVDVDSVWAVSTAYVVADRVRDPDTGTIWDALVNHTSGTGTFAADRLAHPSYWAQVTTGIVWRSGWLTATAYRVQDVSSYNGSAYICLEGHTSGVFATDLAAGKWEVFVEKGSGGVGSGDVVGPASAVDNRVAAFDGATGKLIKDGGFLVSELAPKDSPSFTGVPEAPTASAGTSTTQIATTAFTTGAVSDAVTALKAGVSASFDTLAELAAALALKVDKSANGSDFANAATTFSNLKQAATQTATGVVEQATDAEVQTGTDTSRYITPAGLTARSATDTRTGIAELSTNAEGITGTDTGRIVTPAVLRAVMIQTWYPIIRKSGAFATTIDWTDLSAWRMLRLTGAVKLAADGNLTLRTDAANGASFDSGASDYAWMNGYNVGIAAHNTEQATADTSIRLGQNYESTNGLIVIDLTFGEFNQAYYGYVAGEVRGLSTTHASGIAWHVEGYRAQATARNAFQLITSAAGGFADAFLQLDGLV